MTVVETHAQHIAMEIALLGVLMPALVFVKALVLEDVQLMFPFSFGRHVIL